MLVNLDFTTLCLLVTVKISLKQILLEKDFDCVIILKGQPLVRLHALSISLAYLIQGVHCVHRDVSEVILLRRIPLFFFYHVLYCHLFTGMADWQLLKDLIVHLLQFLR